MTNGGKTLGFTEPLKYKHLGEIIPLGSGFELEAYAEVALLTRNIVLRGADEKDDQWKDKIKPCPDGFNPGEYGENKLP